AVGEIGDQAAKRAFAEAARAIEPTREADRETKASMLLRQGDEAIVKDHVGARRRVVEKSDVVKTTAVGELEEKREDRRDAAPGTHEKKLPGNRIGKHEGA